MGLFDGTPLERPVACDTCGSKLDSCVCPRDADGNVCRSADQAARVHREKRRGKWVTVVTGLDPTASDRAALLKEAKRRCSAGGATTPDGFEVQGDHRDPLVRWLKQRGYPAKPAGG